MTKQKLQEIEKYNHLKNKLSLVEDISYDIAFDLKMLEEDKEELVKAGEKKYCRCTKCEKLQKEIGEMKEKDTEAKERVLSLKKRLKEIKFK